MATENKPKIFGRPNRVGSSTQPCLMEVARVSREITEERAVSKMIWGEREDHVRQFLRDQGFPPEEEERVIARAIAERAVEMRKSGIGKIVWGSLLIVVCGSVILFMGNLFGGALGFVSFSALGLRGASAIGLATAGTLFGLQMIGTGIYRLVKGAKVVGQVY